MEEVLDIVDSNDRVVGSATRTEVHEKGLWHREVGIVGYTQDGRIVFQKRALTKKIFPGMFGMFVAGHVPSGMDYLQAALIELEEETGVVATPDELRLIETGVWQAEHVGKDGSLFDNTYYQWFGYEVTYIDSLEIEEGEGAGFEAFYLDEITAEDVRFNSDFVSDEWKGRMRDVFPVLQRKTA